MPGTYLPIRNDGQGSGVAIDSGEMGAFEMGFDEFGGGATYVDGVTFLTLDNATQNAYAKLSNDYQTYIIVNIAGG